MAMKAPKDHKLTDAEVEEVRAQTAEIIERGTVKKAQLARESGVSTSALSQFLAGKYTGRNDAVAGRLKTWIETHHRRREAESQLLPGPEFVVTASASRIMDAIMYAHHASDIVLVHGGAGTGKTITMREYRDQNSGVCMATMTDAHTTVATVMREIGNCYGVRRRHDTAALFDNLVMVLRERRGLLLIDEAQHLSTRSLDCVRQIHDAAGCGVVLAGNDEVYTNMSATRSAAYLDRLASRVGMRLSVKAATAVDSGMLLDAWKIKDKEVRELLQSVARKPGGLRQMDKVIRCAHMYAEDERVTQAPHLSPEDIKHAWELLGGDQS